MLQGADAGHLDIAGFQRGDHLAGVVAQRALFVEIGEIAARMKLPSRAQMREVRPASATDSRSARGEAERR